VKNIIYLIEFIFIKILFLIFSLIGYKNSSNFGSLIGKLIGPFFRSKSLIIKNLRQAQISNKDNLEKISTNVLSNYGRIFSEYVYLKDFRNDKLKKYISIEGTEYLDEIKKKNKKVVFISGHFNNFELMAMNLEKFGINVAAIYRPLNNKYLNKTMEEIRKNFICQKQIKKGRSGTRELIKNFNKGSSVALMIDQRVREGIDINFFYKHASTTTIPAQLSIKYNCEIVPIYIERQNKIFFKMFVSKPILFDKNESVEEITLKLNKILEKMILKNVDQWIWTHDRWQK
jgi:Kdo2-lipid IVA lauroyltransferase/acyltransferase